VALTISVSLAQVGEFSFILAGLGVELGLLPEDGRDLILAGAIVSIIVNPFLFDLLQRFRPAAKPGSATTAAPGQAPEEIIPTALIGHAVIVGYGRVGSAAGEMLAAAGRPFFVIEESPKVVDGLRARGIEAISGNAVRDEIAGAAGIPAAAWLLVAIPEAYEASQIVRHARTHNPSLVIIARAHFDAEVEHLQEQGANVVIMGEREIARGMVERVLAGTRAKPPFASETKPAGESEAGSGGVAA
jgi:CPA2 family monovalent cation:H+ antiporter-2